VISERQHHSSQYLLDLTHTNVEEVVRRNHSYRLAPEPLYSLQSVFQALHSPSANCLFLYLTNISSQHIRRTLTDQVLEILERDHLRPTTTWIQICNVTYPTIAFRTRTTEEVLTAITTAQTKLGMIRIPDNKTVLPWTTEGIEILMHHPCSHRDERALPERMNPQTATPTHEPANVTAPKGYRVPADYLQVRNYSAIISHRLIRKDRRR